MKSKKSDISMYMKSVRRFLKEELLISSVIICSLILLFPAFTKANVMDNDDLDYISQCEPVDLNKVIAVVTKHQNSIDQGKFQEPPPPEPPAQEPPVEPIPGPEPPLEPGPPGLGPVEPIHPGPEGPGPRGGPR